MIADTYIFQDRDILVCLKELHLLELVI
jgi:hypothetical protein